MKFYRIIDDVSMDDRWFLGNINFTSENDIWKFIGTGAIDDVQNDLMAQVTSKGAPLDLTLSDFELLIGNEKVANILNDDDVQKIPITIEGVFNMQYFCIVIKNEIDCIDREKSEFTVWESGNTIRPDLAGTYRNFNKIVVDPNCLSGLDICRIKDFNVAVIVSERVKKDFDKNGFKGVSFLSVS